MVLRHFVGTAFVGTPFSRGLVNCISAERRMMDGLGGISQARVKIQSPVSHVIEMSIPNVLMVIIRKKIIAYTSEIRFSTLTLTIKFSYSYSQF